MKIILVCMECGEIAHAPWPTDRKELDAFERTLWKECRYVLSLTTRGNGPDRRAVAIKDTHGVSTIVHKGTHVLMPLCEACARKVHGGKLVDAASQLLTRNN